MLIIYSFYKAVYGLAYNIYKESVLPRCRELDLALEIEVSFHFVAAHNDVSVWETKQLILNATYTE